MQITQPLLWKVEKDLPDILFDFLGVWEKIAGYRNQYKTGFTISSVIEYDKLE